jgi:hypothetical protein
MPDVRDADSWDESEFGLGSGMVDPGIRADRNALPAEIARMEIVNRPKTFDNSMPNRPDLETTPIPRLLPGESEADRA